MALHDDLLDQADHLASREPKKPRQASLRRSVSAAYYALYHLLAAEGAQRFMPARPPQLRQKVRRAYVHANMREVCEKFSRRISTDDSLAPLLSLPIEADLIAVAATFVALQEARHQADYDLTMTFNRVDVLEKLRRARTAMANWKSIRTRPNTTVFLAALLLQRQWR